VPPYGMWRCVFEWELPDVSKVRRPSLFQGKSVPLTHGAQVWVKYKI